MRLIITNGKLDLSQEYKNSAPYQQWCELMWNKAQQTLFGMEPGEPELPGDDELTVFVADANPPMFKLGQHDVVRVSTGVIADDLFVARAHDTDRNETVLIATTSERTIDIANGAFVVLSLNEWKQMPEWLELVRIFRNPIEAEAATRNGTVIIPWSGFDGWQGVLVHGAQIDDDVALDPSRMSELSLEAMIGVPDGISIEHHITNATWSDIAADENDNPFKVIDVHVSRIVVTKDGGVYVLVELNDGEHGRKIVGRHFSHSEAKERLSL